MKTAADRRARDPVRLFVGRNQTNGGALSSIINTQNNAPTNVINNQMKEVDNRWLNAVDTMGTNCKQWFMPWGDNPACDGFNWHMRKIH